VTTFEVDVAELRDMAGRLKGLKEEFESQEDTVSGYDDAVGSNEVAGALEEFANNWSDKRRELAEKLEEVAGYASMAADAYHQTEGDLASSIDDSKAANAGSNGSR